MKEFAEIFRKFIAARAAKGRYDEVFLKYIKLVETHSQLETTGKHVLFEIPVTHEMCNQSGVMHGGALATVLDLTTTLAILKFDKEHRKTVSVDLNLSFLSPLPENQTLYARTELLKIGKSMVFTAADLYHGETLKLCASGRHVKAITPEKWHLE